MLSSTDEDGCARAFFLLLVEMLLAVLQLRDAQRDRFGVVTKAEMGDSGFRQRSPTDRVFSVQQKKAAHFNGESRFVFV